ncbi:hypothetical protein GF380_01415, partial [Candidatus Uhrbacteria bacterium]|nr:hypothetical protein [Candidatus Uhrbacteria bacterium]MBD3283938.1 hypothetical protein [Candidatus Uhrbacteria bacterium]
MFNKLKQIKDSYKIRKTLSQKTSEGTGAWGKVKVTIDGTQQVQSVEIDPSLMNDKQAIEKGVKDAVNAAMMSLLRSMASDPE